MCPHYKLDWFKRRYSEPELKQIKVLVRAAFDFVANTWGSDNSNTLQGETAAEVEADTVSHLSNICVLYATHNATHFVGLR